MRRAAVGLCLLAAASLGPAAAAACPPRLSASARARRPDMRSAVASGRAWRPDMRSAVASARAWRPETRSAVASGRAWRPDMRSAVAYARRRRGDIAFAVRFDGGFYAYRPDHREWSASALKAMLLVAYLDRSSVASRPLSGRERDVLRAMITRSDNNAADAIDTVVGASGLRALARRAGMTEFTPAEPIWGESLITARDQTRFLLHVDALVVPRHRAYAMTLLAGIVASQRWGVGEVAPRGWKLYFKGGWGAGTGLIDNQVALLTRGCARVSLAVLTMHDGSHAYGKQTLRGLFARLLRGLAAVR